MFDPVGAMQSVWLHKPVKEARPKRGRNPRAHKILSDPDIHPTTPISSSAIMIVLYDYLECCIIVDMVLVFCCIVRVLN